MRLISRLTASGVNGPPRSVANTKPLSGIGAVARAGRASHRPGSDAPPACRSWPGGRAMWPSGPIRPVTIPDRKSRPPSGRADRRSGSGWRLDDRSGRLRATAISFSISAGVRYSRGRSSALVGGWPGTDRFSLLGSISSQLRRHWRISRSARVVTYRIMHLFRSVCEAVPQSRWMIGERRAERSLIGVHHRVADALALARRLVPRGASCHQRPAPPLCPIF